MPRPLPVITTLAPPCAALLSWALLATPAAAEPVLVTIDARIGMEARGRERGLQAARADIAAGTLKLFEPSGPGALSDPRRAARERRLRAKGFRLEQGPGCTDLGEQRGYAAAYNERMVAEAQRRFGADFWAQLDRDVDGLLHAAGPAGRGAKDR